MTKISKLKKYYKQFDEWSRLDSPSGKLEFELSMRHLEKYLKPNSNILDLGGGPGRYVTID